MWKFFQSAAKVQQIGDRVHVALPAEVDEYKRKHRESYIYGIYDASFKAGYNESKKVYLARAAIQDTSM